MRVNRRSLLALTVSALTLGLTWAIKPTGAASTETLSPKETRQAFHKLLERPKVDLAPELTTETKDGFLIERGRFRSEANQWVPFLTYRTTAAADAGKALPAVIVLHGTGGNKETTADLLRDMARRGMFALAIDARYHGARIAGGAHGAQEYNEAIIRAWREKDPQKQEHPFYWDTAYDLWRTVDYLETRKDVDAKRVGMMGISMGGIQTWFAAAGDERIKVVVPAIGVQSLKWSLENERWHARAFTIKTAHEAAAQDLGEPEINAKVCRVLWGKIVPGITDRFDCPQMLRAIAPRPMLIVNGEKDPNCPIEGARIAFAAAEETYRSLGKPEHLKVDVAEGVGHAVTPAQRQMALDWLAKWLNASPAD